MIELLLREALQRLNQPEKLQTYLRYLKDEWIETKADLEIAMEDEYTLNHLKLPARLKLELRRIVAEQQTPKKEEEESAARNSPSAKYSEPKHGWDDVEPTTLDSKNQDKGYMDDHVSDEKQNQIYPPVGEPKEEYTGENFADGDEKNNGWQLFYSEEYQSYYYYNPETGESQWAVENENQDYVPTDSYEIDGPTYSSSAYYQPENLINSEAPDAESEPLENTRKNQNSDKLLHNATSPKVFRKPKQSHQRVVADVAETRKLVKKYYLESSDEEPETNSKFEKSSRELESSSISSDSKNSEYFIISEDNRNESSAKVEKYKIPRRDAKENSLFVDGVDYSNIAESNYFLDASAPVLDSNQPFDSLSPARQEVSAIPYNESVVAPVVGSPVSEPNFLSLALGSPSPTRRPPPRNNAEDKQHPALSPDRFPLKIKAQPSPQALNQSQEQLHEAHQHKEKKSLFGKLFTKSHPSKPDKPHARDKKERREKNIKTLVDLGYAEKTAIFALEVVNDDLNEAILMLSEAMGDPFYSANLNEQSEDFSEVIDRARLDPARARTKDKNAPSMMDWQEQEDRTSDSHDFYEDRPKQSNSKGSSPMKHGMRRFFS
jgi:NACalpha-BTF3-like transcription factor